MQLDPAGLLEARMRETRSRQGFLIEREGRAYFAAGPRRVLRRPTFSQLRGLSGRQHAVGWLGYEMAGQLERLPLPAADGLLLLFDRVEEVPAGSPAEPGPVRCGAFKGLGGRARFESGVRTLKAHIRAGDIFQAVLSEPFEAPLAGSPADVYRRLRRESPSPFHFWLADGDTHHIGASPERLVAVAGGMARNMPIAGTRRRGKTAEEDRRLEKSLLRSPKERAEHVMLVDLARNDLGRVCAPGSVKVAAMMEVRRFSNVMHLVSEVEGRLARGRTRWDALSSCFPAGTVSGAPKVRAMELIAGLEKRARSFYAGVVLHADDAGGLESILTIRSLRMKGGKALIQAGAGIVADSRPEREYQEVLDKLAALREALA